MFLSGTGRFAAAREAPLPPKSPPSSMIPNPHGEWAPEEALGSAGGSRRLGRLEQNVTQNAKALIAAARRTVPPLPRRPCATGPPPPGT